MNNEPYITAKRQRKINVNIFLSGVITGMIVMAIPTIMLQPANAESDAVTKVRQAQSEIYNTSTNTQNELREIINKLEYIKATSHENAKMLDFTRE